MRPTNGQSANLTNPRLVHFLLTSLALALIGLGTPSGAGASVVGGATTDGCPSTACSIVLSNLQKGARETAIPTNLTPSLSVAENDLHSPLGGLCKSLDVPGLDDAYRPCYFGPASLPGKKVLLLGDSTAELWSSAIEPVEIAAGNNFTLLYHAGCRVTTTVNSLPEMGTYTGVPTPSACSQWLQAAIQFVKKFDPAIVIVSSSNLLPNSEQRTFKAGLTKLLTELKSTSRKFYLIGNTPELAQDGPICLAAHESNIQFCSSSRNAAFSSADEKVLQSVAKSSGATLINIVPWVCTTSICPAVAGKYEIYQDQFHLTSTYASFLAPVMSVALGL